MSDVVRARVHFETDDDDKITITVRPEALADFRRGDLISESHHTAVRPVEKLFTWEQAS